MGRLGKILSFVRGERGGAKVSDSQVDPGAGANILAEHFSALGDDSYPLRGDYVALLSRPGNGREVAVGYLDPLNAPKAGPGEKRTYSRDENGAVIGEVWQKADGEILVKNPNGSVKLGADGSVLATTPGGTFEAAADGSITGDNGAGSYELQAGGTFLVNNVTIDPAGNIITPGTIQTPAVTATTSLSVNGVEMDGHNHAQGPDSNGDTQQDTGPAK